MTVRESWEEVSFQVFTDEDGVLRSGFYPTGTGLVNGNVAVDYVWGNHPLQPDDDRTDIITEIGGGEGDAGYQSTYTRSSDTLRTADYTVTVNNVGLSYTTPADSHSIATTGYSNFPGFLPDYSGDGDTGLEVVVPKVVGMTVNAAHTALDNANLQYDNNTVIPQISYVLTTAEKVTVTVDTSAGLKKGDRVWFENVIVDGNTVGFGWITLTGVTATSVSFANEGSFEIDFAASGEIWGESPASVRVIEQNPAAGDIVNEGDTVQITFLYID